MASTTSDSSGDAAAELWAETVAFDASLYGAENNHSRYGWLVGPVVDPNPGWKPSGWYQLDRVQQSRQGVKEALIKADLEAGRRPANNMLRCSKLLFDGLYCPIVVADDPAGRQCGHMYERNATLARHIRDHHAGCFEPPSQRVSEDEVEAVHKARLMIVAKGIWRDYEFVNPVGQMDGTEFYKIAEDCERRAARDPEFAARLGKDFHRAPVAPSVPSPAATRARQAQRVRRVSAAAGLTGSPSAAGPATPAPTGATPRRRPDTEPPRPASRRSTRIAARLETARPNTSDDE